MDSELDNYFGKDFGPFFMPSFQRPWLKIEDWKLLEVESTVGLAAQDGLRTNKKMFNGVGDPGSCHGVLKTRGDGGPLENTHGNPALLLVLFGSFCLSALGGGKF